MNLDLRFYQELKESLEASAEKYAAEVASGKASSYDDYRYRAGIIRGIGNALNLAKDINQRVIGITDERKEK